MGGVVGHSGPCLHMVYTAISLNIYNGPPTLIYCGPLLHSTFTLPLLPLSTENYRNIAELLLLSLCEALSRAGPPNVSTALSLSFSLSLSLLCRVESPSSLCLRRIVSLGEELSTRQLSLPLSLSWLQFLSSNLSALPSISLRISPTDLSLSLPESVSPISFPSQPTLKIWKGIHDWKPNFKAQYILALSSYNMHRWMRQRKQWPQVKAPTMERAPDSVRCGKWDLRATQNRRNRAISAQDLSVTEKQLTTCTKKRKRHASPSSSANSVVGENNIQAGHKDAKQFKSKGLDHYDLLVELCEGTLATGAFAGYPSTLGGPTAEGEREMMRQGKSIRMADQMSMDLRGKRKSDGTGGSSSKSIKIDERTQAYATFGYAQQKKGEYFEKMTADQFSVPDCIQALDEIASCFDEEQYYKAYEKLAFGPPTGRQGFMGLSIDRRVGWVQRLK
ncbi:hypothetical protein RHMOL_Rhmol01G0286300 [Rhododendron molle]|uniref:Uncharacterized protein n=1 Tax=Rhododendron molle TaxID=49168 RepID=A0ACC0Q9P8_RHOML|nr:hypothetical protein RHMOL_Rhmol01G0286300 [Rhododendron molle]